MFQIKHARESSIASLKREIVQLEHVYDTMNHIEIRLRDPSQSVRRSTASPRLLATWLTNFFLRLRLTHHLSAFLKNEASGVAVYEKAQSFGGFGGAIWRQI